VGRHVRVVVAIAAFAAAGTARTTAAAATAAATAAPAAGGTSVAATALPVARVGIGGGLAILSVVTVVRLLPSVHDRTAAATVASAPTDDTSAGSRRQ